MSEISEQQRLQPRKPPKQARSRETVRAIVEAAARVLEVDGLDGFSTNAVAERAGVSIGSLYQYFPRKEAIVRALIEREELLLVKDLEAATAEPSGVAALSALIDAAIAHQFRRPALARLLDFAEARQPLDADAQQTGERFRAILANVLLRPDLPRQADGAAAARDVVAIVKGMVDAAGAHEETDRNALSIRARRAVLGYLNASP